MGRSSVPTLLVLSLVSNEAVRALALRVRPVQALLIGCGAVFFSHVAWWSTVAGGIAEPYRDYWDYSLHIVFTTPGGFLLSVGTAPVHFGLIALALGVTTLHQSAAGLISLIRLIWLVPPYCFALAVSESGRSSFGFSMITKPAWVHAPAWNHLTGLTSVAVLIVLTMLHSVWVARSAPRDRAGLCPMCGYDVRGVNDTCPECGEAVAQEKPAGKPAG